MNNKTEIKYWVTWESSIQRTATFTSRALIGLNLADPMTALPFTCRDDAETWYYEKLAEGKNPQLWKERIASTFEAMRPTTTQEDN